MALEVLGEAFLEAGFGVLLEKIAYPAVVKFFKKTKSSDLLLKKLKISLLSIHAVLSDAEEKQMRNASVKEWMEELKDVVFDADDLMDEICTYAKIGENRDYNFAKFKSRIIFIALQIVPE
jgi:hypothetical protein